MSYDARLSIIVPFFDEEHNVAPVLTELRRFHPDAEILAVDDGSSDGTARALAGANDVRTIRLPRHMGQSAAIYRGLVEATGDVCVLMDGDGQSNPADIKRLLAKIPEYDLVIGARVRRGDTRTRVLVSKLANRIRDWTVRDGVTDTGGSPKAMKRECVAHLVPFDGLHRFLPALLLHAGFRVIEVPVAHRERIHGVTKYTTFGRAIRGAWDLLGVRWLLRRRYLTSDLGLADARNREREKAVDGAVPRGD